MANAIDILKEDHEDIRGLLKQLTDNANGRNRKELLSRIHRELKIHTKLEEDIFYPAFRQADARGNGPLYHESLEEHHIVEDMVMPDVERAEIDDGQFAGRANVLRELVEHHADDEETEMFPRARQLLSEEQLEELGKKIEKRREELRRQSA